jgi:hypothetical protein
MVEIISPRDGPRPQDARLKALIDNNRATITRLADHLTQGGYSANKAAKAAPAPAAPERRSLHVVGGSPAPTREAHPVVRATINGRVIVVDDNSGRQLHHLGEIRRRGDEIRFVLASAENRFPAPVAAEIAAAIEDLDAAELAPDGGEEALVDEIGRRLGLAAL